MDDERKPASLAETHFQSTRKLHGTEAANRTLLIAVMLMKMSSSELHAMLDMEQQAEKLQKATSQP